MAKQSPRTVGLTYHPGGTGTSPSLVRARKPFRIGNAAIGLALLCFVSGVYTYSIAAVKQDDFSDVEDLLPPLASRAGMRSIEDEERDLLATIGATKERDREREVPQTSSPSALSSGIPHSSSSTSSMTNSNSNSNLNSISNSNPTPTSWLPLRWRRLSDMEWVKKNGWADKSGNVIIWGAPDVDNIGRMGDRADIKGKRGL